VTFTVADLSGTVDRIHVVGDFNGWDRRATPMHRSGEAHSTTLVLAPDRYRFRYLSQQGEWFNDDTVSNCEFNEFGQKNCVLDLALTGARRGTERWR
jgi:1,4-alpha-glucan branching enzyme